MLRATDKITALYCRLSVEDTKEKDGKDDPSNSIQHQQIMLMGMQNLSTFRIRRSSLTTGTAAWFSNRPGFQKILRKLKPVVWKTVITKDLGKLGRNSSLTRLYINYTFPRYTCGILPSTTTSTPLTPTAPTATWQVSRNWFNGGTPKIPAAKSVPSTGKGERGSLDHQHSRLQNVTLTI